MNEAALLAARRDIEPIGMMQLDEAIDRVIAGPERRSRVMSENEKRVIAYHEAGHALVGHVLPDADDVHKVSIVARGRALGLTWFLPEDRYTHSRRSCGRRWRRLLGGRTAEELVFGEITTGAANDIEKCTEIARAMVTQYGMSDKLGPRKLGEEQGEVFLGRDPGHEPTTPTRSRPDRRRGQPPDRRGAQRGARHPRAHRATLDGLADALIERETVEDGELLEIFAGVGTWPGSDDRRTPGRERAACGSSPDPVQVR